jgi:hypothetical protein
VFPTGLILCSIYWWEKVFPKIDIMQHLLLRISIPMKIWYHVAFTAEKRCSQALILSSIYCWEKVFPWRYDIMQHLMVRKGAPKFDMNIMQHLLLRIGVPKVWYYAAFTAEIRRSPKVWYYAAFTAENRSSPKLWYYAAFTDEEWCSHEGLISCSIKC